MKTNLKNCKSIPKNHNEAALKVRKRLSMNHNEASLRVQ